MYAKMLVELRLCRPLYLWFPEAKQMQAIRVYGLGFRVLT